MSDYIKREDAIRIARLQGKHAQFDGMAQDVAPVRHGRWKHERLPSTSGGSYAVVRCSVCEYQYPMIETNYCPNCGAKMDR